MFVSVAPRTAEAGVDRPLEAVLVQPIEGHRVHPHGAGHVQERDDFVHITTDNDERQLSERRRPALFERLEIAADVVDHPVEVPATDAGEGFFGCGVDGECHHQVRGVLGQRLDVLRGADRTIGVDREPDKVLAAEFDEPEEVRVDQELTDAVERRLRCARNQALEV